MLRLWKLHQRKPALYRARVIPAFEKVLTGKSIKNETIHWKTYRRSNAYE